MFRNRSLAVKLLFIAALTVLCLSLSNLRIFTRSLDRTCATKDCVRDIDLATNIAQNLRNLISGKYGNRPEAGLENQENEKEEGSSSVVKLQSSESLPKNDEDPSNDIQVPQDMSGDPEKILALWSEKKPENLEDVAMSIFKREDVVLFTVVNPAFLPLAESWLCHTKPLNVHSKVMFLATDDGTRDRLLRNWPDVQVVSLNMTELLGAQRFSDAGYMRLNLKRLSCVIRLIKIGVRLFMFEADATWLKNPLPSVLSRKTEGDIVAGRAAMSGDGKLTTSFMLLNPTPTVLDFLRKTREIMTDGALKVLSKQSSNKPHDQNIVNDLIKSQYGGIKVVFLPRELFADGQWYWSSVQQKQPPTPLVINNNWVTGADAKIKRAEQHGHWFLEKGSETGACNATAVQRIHADGK